MQQLTGGAGKLAAPVTQTQLVILPGVQAK